MKVKEVALKEVYCAEPESTLSEVAAMMRDRDVGVMPVCEGKKLLGLITDRDIVVTCAARGNMATQCKAKDFMSKNLKTASPDLDLEQAAKIMAENQVRRLPVVERDQIIGMLSLGDVSLALKNKDKLIADTLRRISTPTKTRK
jgi:CBS domain-containing protein